MDKDFLQDILEMKLLSERMDGHYSMVEIEEEKQNLIKEMAFVRADFKNYLMSQTTNIISHFCLIKYSVLTSSHQDLLNHWRGELKNAIIDFQEMETKPKPHNREMVSRALKERWYKDMELPTHTEYVIRRMSGKFEEENIVLLPEMSEKLSSAFISAMPNIIQEMAFGTEETTLNFVNNI